MIKPVKLGAALGLKNLQLCGLYVVCSLAFIYIHRPNFTNPEKVIQIRSELVYWENALEKMSPKYKRSMAVLVQNPVKHYKNNFSSDTRLNNESETLSDPVLLKLEENINSILKNEEAEIENNKSLPLLTLFTTWAPSDERFLCHNNTVSNWRMLHPLVIPLLFTNSNEVANRVIENGWSVLPVSKFSIGLPVLKYMYLDAMKNFKTKLYGYVNSDVLFTNSLVITLLKVLASFPSETPFLVIGRRTNVFGTSKSEASSSEKLKAAASRRGQNFSTWGEDYFITPPSYPWKDIPEVVVGRTAYDNWIVANAKKRKFPTIDSTFTNLASHQSTIFDDKSRRTRHHRHYNHNLISRVKQLVNYADGRTSSAKYYTQFKNVSGSADIELILRH